jgi:RNA polymerase sigma-70 factor (ECF subfamily)
MVTVKRNADTRTEGELLLAALSGETDAFGLLVEPLQARLFRQAAALSGDLASADDLVSETLVEAWRSLDRYDRTCRFSTWLYAILLHRYHKSVRRRWSRPLSLAWLPFVRAQELHDRQEVIPSPAPTPADAAVQSDGVRQVRRCLEALPKKQREAILLRFFQGASLPEMARIQRCPVGTIKSRLHHALEHLRKMKLNLNDLERD